MPGQPPLGDPAPSAGSLPAGALAELAVQGSLGWYFHVPFCRTRCGYCDFNTYTATELGDGASAATWADTTIAEIRLARHILGDVAAPADTVFFGGGTPTQLPAADLGRVLAALGDQFGIRANAEITVEANPDDVTEDLLTGLLRAGVNRISLGMQSAEPSTLRILERTHRSDQLPAVAELIRRSGIEQLSIDLIYGTPGETAGQWRHTLEQALSLAPDHVSAYCLGIEEGTKLGAAVSRGTLRPVDPDEAADRYEVADEVLAAHGLRWYEISNWSQPGAQCRHNLGYWRGGSWWGAGPGAHSHIGGVRWWNQRHPRNWTAALAAGRSPAQAREVLSGAQRHDERVLLGIRLAEGIQTSLINGGTATVERWVADGLAQWLTDDPAAFRLTRSGRLVADRLALAALTDPVAWNIADAAAAPYTGTQLS